MICLFFLSPSVLSFSSFHRLVVWGWGLWTDRVFSLSPGLTQLTPISNNNNNNNNATTFERLHISFRRVLVRFPLEPLNISHTLVQLSNKQVL